MIRSSLCDYSDAYILVKANATVSKTAQRAAVNNTNKKLIFKNCNPFTSCITEINNTHVYNAEDAYSKNAYSKTLVSLCNTKEMNH